MKIRPTSQKVKEALFCILGQAIPGSSFLELFAGSGSIGIEAKSRGAQRVFFVENNRICIKTIEANLKHLKIAYKFGLKSRPAPNQKEASVRLLTLPAAKAIKILNQEGEKFDFVFLDPPYRQDSLKNSLINICLYDILKPHSYVIAEHSQSQVLSQHLLKLRLMFTRRYGDTALSFYQRRPRR